MTFKTNIPDSGETVYVTKGGDDASSGLTPELPVLTIVQSVTNAASSGATSIDISDGNFDEQVILIDGTDLRGKGAGLTSTVASTTTLTAASSSVVDIGFISAAASNSTACLIDGKVRTQLITTTLVIGSFGGPVQDNITGIDIRGTNDDIPADIANGECRATNSTFVDITGTTDTPPHLRLGSVTNFEDGFTLINHNPSDSNQITEVTVSFTNDTAAAATGLNLFTGTSGTLNVTAHQINASGQQIATVGSGLRFGLLSPVIAGNITVDSGGDFLATSMGFMLGDLDIQGDFTGSISDLAGDLTIGSGSTFNGIITEVTGSITVDPAATVNGSINGVRYGNWEVASENVTYNNTSSGRAAENTQDALDEAFSEIDANGGLGYTLVWGANMQTTGRYAQVNGITSGGQETGLSAGSEYIVPADGTLDCLTYNTDTGNATTVFKIWKNGAFEHTFTATGAADFEEDIGLSVVAGDLIAIEYDAGMRPAGSVYVAYID